MCDDSDADISTNCVMNARLPGSEQEKYRDIA
jgi:hypothetical protein